MAVTAFDQAHGPRIAVLMTCHNRRETTLDCLRALATQAEFRAEDLFLVDDGSRDGTGRAVLDLLPQANVIEGDGTLFWNGGMRLAWERASAAAMHYDWYFWLNDDVELLPHALEGMLADAERSRDGRGAVICAGATISRGPEGEVTYGGHFRPDPRRRPLRMRLATPDGTPKTIDTISGNAVLVSAAAFERLGSLDPMFEHIYGDLDYGLRARAAGVPCVLAGKPVGYCDANPVAGSSLDPALSRLARLRARWWEAGAIHGRDWRRFVARYSSSPMTRMGHRLSPYLRILLNRPHQ
ncbi:glycosyltransferase family 2 protein [Qipengyuania aquimaris]|uniref:glycosyltransferase family 2 protein n=1 Tax=Qipengyuania aquimaris TaxID=255984 RepID=UPI001CD24EBA|nr:glycosyltransferase family 2 protein [Qipengyuania aquimaris]MCA0903660.1 glycosyltransferase family 2 protein [Qipengyuania aquimaris]